MAGIADEKEEGGGRPGNTTGCGGGGPGALAITAVASAPPSSTMTNALWRTRDTESRLLVVTAGDKIDSHRQWASGRCLSADRAGVYSRTEGMSGGRVRRVVREAGGELNSTGGLSPPSASFTATPTGDY